MGVPGLWTILEDAAEDVHLEDLRGKLVAVDLSYWLIAAVSASQKVDKDERFSDRKPYLRSLFARITLLLRHGVTPIFITEGPPPLLKKKQFCNLRKSPFINSQTVECKQLIEGFGLSTVESFGEAEQMAAQLNANNKVDAVISNDIDALLFGAKVVYRNFTCSSQNVIQYDMEKIEVKFGISRNSLIGAGLLLGCDFCDGVNSVGLEKVKCLLKNNSDLIKLFFSWKSENYCDKCHSGLNSDLIVQECTHCSSNASSDKGVSSIHSEKKDQLYEKTELIVKKAVMAKSGFPNKDVIALYKETIATDSIIPRLSKPDVQLIMESCEETGWTRLKMLDLLAPTLILMQLYQPELYKNQWFQPIEIVNTCKHKFKPSFNVKWQAVIHNFSNYTWCEKCPQNLMQNSFSIMCQNYFTLHTPKKKKARIKSRTAAVGSDGQSESVKRKLSYQITSYFKAKK